MKSVILALLLGGCATMEEPKKFHWRRDGEFVAVFDREGNQVSPWILDRLLGEEGLRVP